MGLAAILLCAAFSLPPNAQAATDSATTGSVREAASDSTKPIRLPTVVVSARRAHRPESGTRPGDAAWIPSSARSLYDDDGSKLLFGDLRISSPLPASADLRLYGLPVDQTARDYVWGHRIGGPTTAVFGSRTKINPDIVQVALLPYLMSHRYRDTNGSLELQPVFQSNHAQSVSLSSDAIERRVTAYLAQGSNESPSQLQIVTGLRQSDVAPFLKSAVPELKVIPRYFDSQTHARWRTGDQTIEGFLLLGRERGDWRETTGDGVDAAVIENTRQDLAILRSVRLLPGDAKLTTGVSWEGDHVASEHRYGDVVEHKQGTSHIVNPRIEYSARRDAVTVWASDFLVESVPGGSLWKSSLDAGAEGCATAGWFTVQPSLAFQRFHDEGTIVHGVTARAHPRQVTLSAGYGTYVDYFVFHDGIFKSVFDSSEAQAPQRGTHYVASIQYEPQRRRPFDLVRVTGVRKDLDVDLWGSRNAVRVLSWDLMMAKGGKRGWELAALTNDVRTSDGPLIGMIPFSLRAGVSGDLGRWFDFAVEANYRSGSIAEYRAPGPRFGEKFKLDPSHYLNLAVTRKFDIANRPANVTITVFNVLAVAGSKAELTVDEYGRRYDAPCWANIRLHYDLW